MTHLETLNIKDIFQCQWTPCNQGNMLEKHCVGYPSRSFVAKSSWMLPRSQQRLCGRCPGNLRSPFVLRHHHEPLTRRQDPRSSSLRSTAPPESHGIFNITILSNACSQGCAASLPVLSHPHTPPALCPIVSLRFLRVLYRGLSHKQQVELLVFHVELPPGWANADGF